MLRFPRLCIEIKSTEEISRNNILPFIKITKDMGNVEAICICDEEYVKKLSMFWCYHGE